MGVRAELLRTVGVSLLTVLLAGFLAGAPGFFTLALLVPLGVALWLWPEGSTAISYLAGAILGTLLSAWSVTDTAGPLEWPFVLIWSALVWGPAGVVVKRLELLFLNVFKKPELPRI